MYLWKSMAGPMKDAAQFTDFLIHDARNGSRKSELQQANAFGILGFEFFADSALAHSERWHTLSSAFGLKGDSHS